MSTMLEQQMFQQVAAPPVSKDPEEHATHAAAPTEYSFKTGSAAVLWTIAAFYIIIYLLHAIERMLSR